ncbi:MAG: methyltransferase [Gammaproteobacteria bacterium]
MNQKAFSPPAMDDRVIWDRWLSAHEFPAMTAADQTGIFSSLCAGAKTTEEIAAELGLIPRTLGVLLGYLAAMGLAERHEGRWQASAAARGWLDPDSGGYWGPLLGVFKRSHPLHEQLLNVLTQENPAAAPGSGVEEWEQGEMEPGKAEGIAGFMNAHSISAARAVSHQPLLRDVSGLLDVGGGSGIFSIAAARAHPHLKATVLEIEAMCRACDAYIAASDIGDRVDTTTVNMFTEDLPSGYDAHFYSNVFHDWSEQTNALLARKSYDALPHGGRILLHEMLVNDDGCGPLTTLSFSILMLIGTRGRQYSLAELRRILEGAGFVNVGAVQTGSGYYSLVSASKP